MSATIQITAQDRVFILTGAGISAESGIPTFRDSDGLWSGYRVEDVATPEAWADDAGQVWRFYAMRRGDALSCEPNPAHFALAELEHELGDRLFLCTQTADPLHERAGSERVTHMHGELFRSRCERECGRGDFADEGIYDSAEQDSTLRVRRPDQAAHRVVWRDADGDGSHRG